MAKKETTTEIKPTITVFNNTEVVKTFDSVEEAYKFASENGYRVEVQA